MDLEKRYSRLPDRLYSNFGEMFRAICSEFRDLPAMRIRLADGAPYTVWTYAGMRDECLAVARFLASRGLGQGDRVAIIGENRPEWCFAYLAAVISGFVVVPVDATIDAQGLTGILEASRAKALFHSNAMASKVAEAIKKRPVKVIVEFAAPADPPADARELVPALSGAVSWADALAGEPAGAAAAEDGLPAASDIDGNTAAVIIYTSGTTGLAKGIVLSHRGIIANINASIQSLNVGSDDVFIAVLPLHHTYAATCTFLAPLEAGGSLTFVEKIVPSVILRHVRESGVTLLIGVPLLFDKIKQGIRSEIDKLHGPAALFVKSMSGLSSLFLKFLHLPAGRVLLGFLRAKAGIGSVRLGVAGGGPLALDTAEFFETLGFNLVQGYGMSENGPLIAVNLPEYKDNRSVGLPVKHTSVRIAEQGSDGVGEIQVRSPSLMLGYLDAPEATAVVMTADGWLRTGDLGYVDGRGFIFITGRSKNIIVTEGGKNVYPEEIELRFEGSRWIKEVLVLGRKVGGLKTGEHVIAVCVPDWDRIDAGRDGQDRAAFAADRVREEIRAINRTLPPFMKIVDHVIRDDEFEKTSTRKIRRFLYAGYAETRPAGLREAGR
ncbi:MAG: AMP-dependent synthetase [Spirochaetae bacterium HGW-Spirochaetae-7]|jgi:long-chain acyl-CoA synthetase|nr:MAG: AMP-dependent synthetase [Spirochaetae bacterium HGW-Spirochaetae-7]